MSVMEFSLKELARVGESIAYYRDDLENSFYSVRERFNLQVFAPEKVGGTIEYGKAVDAFIERVYIANRLTFQIQYPGRANCIHIHLPKTGELHSFDPPLSRRKLWEILGSIRYNCVTNDGRLYLSKEDDERIQDLQHALAWRLGEEES